MVKYRAKSVFSALCFLAALAIMIGNKYELFGNGYGLWATTASLSLMTLGGFLRNGEQFSWTFSKMSKTDLPECKKALYKSWFGVLICCACLVVMYFAGKNGNYFIVLIGFFASIPGAMLMTSYLKCVREFSEGNLR